MNDPVRFQIVGLAPKALSAGPCENGDNVTVRYPIAYKAGTLRVEFINQRRPTTCVVRFLMLATTCHPMSNLFKVYRHWSHPYSTV